MRQTIFAIAALCLSCATPTLSPAQNFNPVITVNGDAITAFEMDQRIRMLTMFNAQGDLQKLAREQLIEESLKQQELRRVGLRLNDETLQREMESFAGRANLTLGQFIATLSRQGIAEESFRDFVSIGAAWRDYARNKFRSQIQIRPSDTRRALGQNNGVELEVLLSEIIIPAPPELAGRAMAEARRISNMRSTTAFSNAAREFSALPTRENGGRLSWVPISNFPPPLRPLLLNLKNQEITDPIEITNGIALFQMRGVREAARSRSEPSSIEYLTFSLPGGMSDATQSEAATISDRIDVCNDFYGIARDLPAERLQRQTVSPRDIPADIAQVLAGLDDNELSYGLTRNDGNTMLMVMMCNRSYGANSANIDETAVNNRLAGTQLEALSGAYLADLRARAIIR